MEMSRTLDTFPDCYKLCTVNKLPEFLRIAYLEWQKQESVLKTITEFADYLGIPQPNLSRYMNGTSKPDRDYVDKLASKLGARVYEALGLSAPITDDRLRLINEHWDGLPEVTKDALADQAARVKERGDGQKAKTVKKG